MSTQGNAVERETGCDLACPMLLEVFTGDENNQYRNNYYAVSTTSSYDLLQTECTSPGN